jgi:hypothetical protein
MMVVGKIDDVVYKSKNAKSVVVHFDRLKPYTGSSFTKWDIAESSQGTSNKVITNDRTHTSDTSSDRKTEGMMVVDAQPMPQSDVGPRNNTAANEDVVGSWWDRIFTVYTIPKKQCPLVAKSGEVT